MTKTITIDEPGIGYYEDDTGTVIGRFDLPPGEHQVPDEVSNVVYVQSVGDLPPVSRTPETHPLKADFDNANTVTELKAVLEELLF